MHISVSEFVIPLFVENPVAQPCMTCKEYINTILGYFPISKPNHYNIMMVSICTYEYCIRPSAKLCLGQWYTGNGIQGMVYREWYTGNGIQGMVHREWYMGNGTQGMVYREWYTGNVVAPKINKNIISLLKLTLTAS